jgi:hypothetical protein
MANNLRGHVVPPPTGQAPSRQTFLDMMMSVNDIVHVDDDTARQALVDGLVAAGYTINADNPLYVHNKAQADGKQLQSTVDGSTWNTYVAGSDTGWVARSIGTAGWTSNNQVRVVNRILATIYISVKTGGAGYAGGTLVEAMTATVQVGHACPDDIWFLCAQGSQTYRARVFQSGSVNIYGIPALPAATTISGTVTYPVG